MTVEPRLLARLALAPRATADASPGSKCPPGWNHEPLLRWCTSSVRSPASSTTTAEAVKCALGLLPRERIVERLGPVAHPVEIGRLLDVGRLVRGEQRDQVARAFTRTGARSSTFSFDARRAGKIAARIPTMIAAMTKTISVPHGTTNGTSESARSKRSASTSPTGIPSAAPISAVITASCRIIRRVCRRVIPTARSIPISRVRSKTVRTSVFTIPNRLTMIESAEQDVEQDQELVDPLLLVVDELGLGLDLRVRDRRSSTAFSFAVFAGVTPPGVLTNVKTFCGFG